MPVIAFAVALLVALGGGVASMANGTTPGDLLYPFKVGVNERVESALARSTTSQTDVAISTLETRLAEAQSLASSGKLTPSAQATIESNITAHAGDVSTIIKNLQAQGQHAQAADTASRFQGALAAQISTIAGVSAHSGPAVQASLTPILDQIRTELNTVSTLSNEAATTSRTGVLQ